MNEHRSDPSHTTTGWRPGFAYCPRPNARVRRALRRAERDARGEVYTPLLAVFVMFVVAGSALVFGGAAWTLLSHGLSLGQIFGLAR